jgi:long-chain acyl-CoA synthetase
MPSIAPASVLPTQLDYLYHWEKNQPEKPFLHQPLDGQWRTYTWKQAMTEIRKLAAALQAEGFEPGSRIALISKNCAQWIMADYAIMMAGYVSVPIYPNVNGSTVKYILEHSESKLALVGKLDPKDWAEMRKGMVEGVKPVSFGYFGVDTPGYITWDEFIAPHAPMAESPNFPADELMTIIYTSGTTGTPKGVMHRHGAMKFAIDGCIALFDLNENDRFLSYLPLSHIAERMLVSIGVVRIGGTIYFAESLDTFAENLKYASPTVFLAVPRIWTKFMTTIQAKLGAKLNILLQIPVINNVIRKKVKEALGLTQARITITGAAPIPPSLQEWFQKLGITILDVYGMTENCAYSHANTPTKYKFGYAGQPLPGSDWKFTEAGELCVKSPAVMMGYYKEPEKTAEAIQDGYLHTGDKGEMSKDGFLKITGRVKDLFKTSKAKYVAPVPIELKLSENQLIEQVCVVGDGIPQPLALVVLSAEAMQREREGVNSELMESMKSLNQTLEHHERLEKIIVVKEAWTVENGVLTPSLKIKRNVVEDRFSKHFEGWYEGGKGVIWES